MLESLSDVSAVVLLYLAVIPSLLHVPAASAQWRRRRRRDYIQKDGN